MADSSQLFWFFFSLSGRISPAACLLGGLFLVVVQLFLLYQFMRVDPQSPAGGFWALSFWIVVFVSAWCNFALTAKRFHDFGKPGLLALISLVAGFILFIILFFIKGDPGPNQYGQRTNAPG